MVNQEKGANFNQLNHVLFSKVIKISAFFDRNLVKMKSIQIFLKQDASKQYKTKNLPIPLSHTAPNFSESDFEIAVQNSFIP